jgi:predicted Kef-type K+ transport protein
MEAAVNLTPIALTLFLATLGGVLGQVGEFSFVLIALGLENGFIGEKDYQIALAVIALSLAISPLFMQMIRKYFFATTSVPATT